MRIGYMVLPVPVLEMYRAEYGGYSSTVSRFEQQTLCRFMEEGHFARHLNRLRSACRARRVPFYPEQRCRIRHDFFVQLLMG